MRFGIICPSEIAFRRFMPALEKINDAEFVGLAVGAKEEMVGEDDGDKIAAILEKDHEKAEKFVEAYGGKIFDGYGSISRSEGIDALYIPLPPALHYKWADIAIGSGKHVLVEKPCTLFAKNTMSLIHNAKKHQVAVHENYMFLFHEQLDVIDDIISSGEIGEIRLYRITFGFPLRASNDFRYNRELGGGALYDACGYAIRYATRLLGNSVEVRCAQMNYLDGFGVDMYGSGTLVNEKGVTVQIAYGMDNNYKCELEAWGSKGCLTTGRILTAPAGYRPAVTIRRGNSEEERWLPEDDAFRKSIEHFMRCIDHGEIREENYQSIEKQAYLLDEFMALAGGNVI